MNDETKETKKKRKRKAHAQQPTPPHRTSTRGREEGRA
jgi:hypothetical protein